MSRYSDRFGTDPSIKGAVVSTFNGIQATYFMNKHDVDAYSQVVVSSGLWELAGMHVLQLHSGGYSINHAGIGQTTSGGVNEQFK